MTVRFTNPSCRLKALDGNARQAHSAERADNDKEVCIVILRLNFLEYHTSNQDSPEHRAGLTRDTNKSNQKSSDCP